MAGFTNKVGGFGSFHLLVFTRSCNWGIKILQQNQNKLYTH